VKPPAFHAVPGARRATQSERGSTAST